MWGGWGNNAMWSAKDMLVQKVKDWQRRSPDHKRCWDSYCQQAGHTKLDPSLKEEPFLKDFLEQVEAGLIVPQPLLEFSGDGGLDKASLVEGVKQWQRMGTSHKNSWWNYCRSKGTQDFDPNRHDPQFLQAFLQGCENGTIQPTDDSGGFDNDSRRTRKGSSGDDWGGGMGWGMDPFFMMMMMKGKAMKGAAKGMAAAAAGGCPPMGGAGGAGAGAGQIGEIRYDDPEHAQQAFQQLNGTMLQGSLISVEPDTRSKDGTKLIVRGIAPGMQWQELKDYFSPIGTVAYAGIKEGSSSSMGGDMGNGGMGGGWGQGAGGYMDPWSAWDAWGPWAAAAAAKGAMMSKGKGGYGAPY